MVEVVPFYRPIIITDMLFAQINRVGYAKEVALTKIIVSLPVNTGRDLKYFLFVQNPHQPSSEPAL